MDKLGKLELNGWTIIGALVVLYIVATPFRSFVDGLLGGIGGTPSGGGSTIECIYDGATMTVGPVEKKYAPTTAITGIGARVFVNGKDRGIQLDSATMNVNYKDDIAIYYAHNDTVANTAKGGYYVAEQKFAVPCSSAFASGDDEVDPSGAHTLIAYSSPSITVFNDDDGLKNQLGHPENVSANDDANLRIKIQHNSESGFSPYGKYAICLSYNSTLYDKVDLSPMSGISGLSTVEVPTAVTNVGHNLGSRAKMTLKCWETAGTSSQSVVTQELNLEISTSSQSPSKTVKTQRTAINMSLWDQDWFRNSDTGKMEMGYEDNDNTDVGDTFAPNSTIYLTG